MSKYDAILQEDSQKIKNFDDFWYYFSKHTCDTGVSSLPDIMSKPSCDSSISDLYDINGYNYHELSGKHICELLSTSHVQKNELMLLTRYVSANTLSSMKMEYSQLSSKLFEDILCGLNLHTMAFEPTWRYAMSTHNHDAVYSRVSWQSNYKDSSEVSTLGVISLSTDYLSGSGSSYSNIDHNPSRKAVNVVTYNINIPKIYVPLPPKPMIGTLKIVGMPTIQKLIDTNQLNVVDKQVNPYDSNNKIRKEYDGWVFANGTIIPNKEKQLSAASLVYNGNDSGNITMPILSNFFKCNPYLYSTNSLLNVKYNAVMLAHQHVFGECKINGKLNLVSALIPFSNLNNDNHAILFNDIAKDDDIKKLSSVFNTQTCHWHTDNPENHQELNTVFKLDNVKVPSVTVEDCAAIQREPYPTHNIVPVMVYIGGETRDYYEYIYHQYHKK